MEQLIRRTVLVMNDEKTKTQTRIQIKTPFTWIFYVGPHSK